MPRPHRTCALFRLCLTALLLSVPLCSWATTYYVSPGGDIQAAISAASSGDTIIVNPGTYSVHLDFGGRDLTLRSTDPTAPAVVGATILDGGHSGSVVSFQGGESAAAVLSGFTIRNGRSQAGGGVYISGASPTVTYNKLANNQAILVSGLGGTGAGLYCSNSYSSITHNRFLSNSAEGTGGGAYLTSQGGQFSDNYVSGCTASAGGGVAVYASATQFLRNTITGCTATVWGGGLSFQASTAAAVNANTVDSNSAPLGGGCYCGTSLVTTFANDLFSRNTATTNQGGGMYIQGCSPELRNCTFVRGDSGIYINGGSPLIDSCLVVWHTVGTGISMGGAGTPHVRYTGFWSNDLADVDGLTPETGCLYQNPLMVDLGTQQYNLKSQTGHWSGTAWVVDAVTSPCLDAGNPALPYNLETAPNGGRVNMGYDGNTATASHSFVSLVAGSAPGNGATGVNRRATIALDFSCRLRQASAESHFHLRPAGGADLPGSFTWPSTRRLAFTPSAPLAAGQMYQILLSTGIRRADGTVVNWSETRSFTTGSQPIVVSSSPHGSSVPRTASIVVTFDTAMNRASVERALSFNPGLGGTYTWSNGNRRLTISHATPLPAATPYLVVIGAAARSALGVRMHWPYSWTFQTAAAAAPLVTASAATAAGGSVAITASLSAPATVGVEVHNLAGRLVAVLPDRQLAAGLHTLLWNGRGVAGTAVAPGRYLLRVTARGSDGSSISALCPVLRR